MKISPSKSFILHLGNNNPKQQYKLGDQIINETENMRDLGIFIDNKLKFSQHYTFIIRNAYLRMHQIFKAIRSGSIKTWTTIYKSYIRPLLEYAPETWSPLLKKDIKKVEQCQKFFTRIALKKCKLPPIPYTDRLTLFKLPTLEQRRIVFDMTMAHKIINRQTHINPEDLFTFSHRQNKKGTFRLLTKLRTYKNKKSFTDKNLEPIKQYST